MSQGDFPPQLTDALKEKGVGRLYFDIDLDYFTESDDPTFGGGKNVRLVSDKEIHKTIEPSSELMKWILPRMSGMTIALEPEFCGGISNANHILEIVSQALFSPQLLRQDCHWKHLQTEGEE